MDGFINFLKPPGMTSHDVVSFIRKTLKTKKVGHTGTLDPGVAGVLPICIGKATRLAEYITLRPKCYRAEITLGITTDSQDAYGNVLSEIECSHVNYKDFEDVIIQFIGQIHQIPPMTSAVRIDGERLYNLARKGIVIERRPKEVTIYHINIINQFWQLPHPKVVFDVCCSKGTYVRTLCHDIGEKLGIGAILSFMIRTNTGPFDIDHAWTIEEISSLASAGNFEFLMPLREGISFIPALIVDDQRSKDISHGKSIVLINNNYSPDQIFQIKDQDNKFLAIGRVNRYDEKTSVFKPEKVFS